MCRITPNQPDKNPCVILCPDINERLTVIINIDVRSAALKNCLCFALLAKRVGSDASGWAPHAPAAEFRATTIAHRTTERDGAPPRRLKPWSKRRQPGDRAACFSAEEPRPKGEYRPRASAQASRDDIAHVRGKLAFLRYAYERFLRL